MDPGSITDYLPIGPRNAPWTYDYYNHVFAAKRLLESAEALNESWRSPELSDAITQFRGHWSNLKGVRDVLQHPKSTLIKWQSVSAFYDRIEYRPVAGADPVWRYTLDQLHDPVEALWTVVEEIAAKRKSSR